MKQNVSIQIGVGKG